jgi:hypothetical protein
LSREVNVGVDASLPLRIAAELNSIARGLRAQLTAQTRASAGKLQFTAWQQKVCR